MADLYEHKTNLFWAFTLAAGMCYATHDVGFLDHKAASFQGDTAHDKDMRGQYSTLALTLVAGAMAGSWLRGRAQKDAGNKKPEKKSLEDLSAPILTDKQIVEIAHSAYRMPRRDAVPPPVAPAIAHLQALVDEKTKEVRELHREAAARERHISGLRRMMEHYGLSHVFARRDAVAKKREEARLLKEAQEKNEAGKNEIAPPAPQAAALKPVA